MNLTQFCQCSGHEDEPIIGYCLNPQCETDKPQYCGQCILDKHQNHKADCKSIKQMIKFIRDYIQMIAELTGNINSIFSLKQINLHTIIKSLSYQMDRLKELEQKLQNQEYEKLTPNLIVLREMYKLTQANFNLNAQNLDYVLEKLSNFLQTAEEIRLNQIQPLQNEAQPAEKERSQMNQKVVIEVQQQQQHIDEQQQINKPLQNCDSLQQTIYYLDQLTESRIKNMAQNDDLLRYGPIQCQKPCTQIIREITTLRYFSFTNNQKGYEISKDQRQIYSQDLQIKDIIDGADQISIFICEPEIPEKVMAIQKIRIEMGYYCIGVCQKEMIQTITCLDVLKHQENKHGFYCIDSMGFSFSNLEREKNNFCTQLGPITSGCIQVEVDRIQNRVIWEQMISKKRFTMDIPSQRKMHLFVGLHSGYAKFQ